MRLLLQYGNQKARYYVVFHRLSWLELGWIHCYQFIFWKLQLFLQKKELITCFFFLSLLVLAVMTLFSGADTWDCSSASSNTAYRRHCPSKRPVDAGFVILWRSSRKISLWRCMPFSSPFPTLPHLNVLLFSFVLGYWRQKTSVGLVVVCPAVGNTLRLVSAKCGEYHYLESRWPR